MPTSITNKNVALVHRKEPQFMTPAPANTSAGAFMISSLKEDDKIAMFVASSTVHYLYHADEDGWVQITSGALAGTFGAGSCSVKTRWSNTYTANGGSTTTLTTATQLTGLAKRYTLRVLTGANAGQERVVNDILTTVGGNTTLYFDALPNAIANTDTFAISSGRFFILNAGTQAAGSFRSYDVLTSTWSSPTITGLPATWGTDGYLVNTASYDIIATGTATSASVSTLVNSAKTWTVNQWANYQVRITAGTGIGQIRNITSNTATALTVSANWTVTPDATSVYELTGSDDYIYALGNNAVTMYRYQISSNVWTTLAPTVARTGAPGAALSAHWIPIIETIGWNNESDIRNGRYIYSFRGAGGGLLDRYDIALNTWLAIPYSGLTEIFTTGTSHTFIDRYIYIRKDATNRMFKYSVSGNYMKPLTTTLIPEGTAVAGRKMWGMKYIESGSVKLTWLYYLQNSGNLLYRILLF